MTSQPVATAGEPTAEQTGREPIGLLMPSLIVGTSAISVSLSGSALNTALPTLTEAFQVSPADIAWVTISFSLMMAMLATVFGRLSDLTGRSRPFAIGIAVGLAGTVLSGLSQDLTQLIFARILQGTGAALAGANSLVYLIEIYPQSRRGFVVGTFEACIAIGMGFGPVIGGLLLGMIGWRAVFFVQIPFGLLILALVPKFMKEPVRDRPKSHQFDFAGAIVFALAVAPMMYALTKASEYGLFSPIVIGCFLLSLVSAFTFVKIEQRVPEPMVSLSMFSNWSFSAGNLAKVCGYFGFASNSFMLPFYWDRALGLPATELGLVLTAFPIGMLIGSVVFGPLSDRVGTRVLATAGMVLLALAAASQTIVQPEMGVVPVMAAALLAGIGTGAFIAPNDSSILSVVPRDRLGVANGVMSISRTLGMLFGSAVAAGLLSARLVANNGAFVPSYHQVFLVVIVVTVLGAFLASVRDPGQKDLPGGHAGH